MPRDGGMRERRRMEIPVLAMVDAFVGGVAVILILIVLASLSDARTAVPPRPDRIVTCTGGEAVSVSAPEGPVATDFTRLAATLAALAPPGALSMKVLVQTPPEGARRCVAFVSRALEDANDAADAGTPGHAAPIFLLDVEYVEADRAAE